MTTDLSFQIPARFAGEPSDGTTVEPGALETCIRKMPTKAAKLIRTRAQRIPFRPGDRYSNKGRIHSRRPILSSSSFRLQYGGGPYIPYCRTGNNNPTFSLSPLLGQNRRKDGFAFKSVSGGR